VPARSPAHFDRLESRRLLAFVTGIVFHDANADGVVNEPFRVSTATVYADLNNNGAREATEPSAVSDADGNYQLALNPGSYLIRAQFPAAYLAPNPVTGYWNLTVAGSNVESFNIAARTASEVNGTVYNDRDHNGVNEERVPLPNREVYIDLNRNGVQEPTEPFDTLGSNGLFNFNLLPGTYRIRAVLPLGWQATGPADGAREITVQPYTFETSIDFGQYRAAQFTGVVYQDTNGNGRRDLAEAPAVAWEVWADENRNGIREAGEPVATTGADGYVAFDVAATAASFTVTPRAGWASPAPVNYSSQDWSGLDLTDDFGVRQQSRLTGTVRQNVTGSGAASGLVMPGISVYLDLNNNGSPDAAEPMAQTNADGVFYFTRGPGTYRVRTVLPAGYTYPNPLNAVQSGTIAAGPPVDVNVGTFGPYKANADNGTVFGTIRVVQDRGPIYAPGEQPVAGVTVWLDQDLDGQPGAGEPITQTDTSGFYAIWGLKFGWKNLRATLPPGYVRLSGSPTISESYSSSGGARDNMPYELLSTAALEVVGREVRYDGARPTVRMTFSKSPAFSLEPADVVLRNQTTGQEFGVTIGWDPVRLTASFTPAVAAGSVLPDGNYRLTVRRGYVRDMLGRASAQDWNADFFVLAGDVNRDRVVNFDDLLVVAKNYNKTGTAYTDGDLSGDGLVNFDDLLILAKGYNQTVPAPAVQAPVVGAATAAVLGTGDTRAPVFARGAVVKAVPAKPKPVAKLVKR
jgi:hypothetical protein